MNGRVLVPGEANGPALVLDEPLSFWGGLDPETGTIVEVSHPQRGRSVAGRILVMPSGRGSSSSATVLAEAIRGAPAPPGSSSASRTDRRDRRPRRRRALRRVSRWWSPSATSWLVADGDPIDLSTRT